MGRELVVVVEAIDEEKPGKLEVMESEKLKISIFYFLIQSNLCITAALGTQKGSRCSKVKVEMVVIHSLFL